MGLKSKSPGRAGIRSNIVSLTDIFFKQITEIGSLTIIAVLIVCLFFLYEPLAIILALGIVCATIISFIIKASFHKSRPNRQKATNTVERIDASSFPSLHSARITIVMFWLILSSNNLVLQIFLAFVGIMVAYSRIYLRKHYFMDVIGGIILGTIINIAIYYLGHTQIIAFMIR